MIHSILEALYDDYLKSKYSNHEQRREDLTALENLAGKIERIRWSFSVSFP